MSRYLVCLRNLIFLLLTFSLGISSAGADIRITQAKWSKATGQLTVKGAGAADPVELYDTSGRRLAKVEPDARQNFQLKLADSRPELLCGIRAKSGAVQVTKAVAGAPNKDCRKIPQCQILAPAEGIALKANQDVQFTAKAKLKDKKAGPLKLEWDFAGGSMGEPMPGTNPVAYKRPAAEIATVQFVRDNSRYRVRFTAMDGKRRYCEDAIEVTVGSPPETPPGVPLMAQQSVETAPALASGKTVQEGGVVVLPLEEWTQQGQSDTRYTPSSIAVANPIQNNINAVAYRKGRVPIRLTDAELSLQFSAASNTLDPAGTGSINSTSQN